MMDENILVYEIIFSLLIQFDDFYFHCGKYILPNDKSFRGTEIHI
jgi:hypothetical protein